MPRFTITPVDLVPNTSGQADKPCVGFDSTSGNEAAAVYNPTSPSSRLIVVGGPYVNTVANCIG